MYNRTVTRILGAVGRVSTFIREGRMFPVLTDTPSGPQGRARLAPQDAQFDWDLLARSYQELERRYQSQAERLGRPSNDNRKTTDSS